jgi:hypothetical protein
MCLLVSRTVATAERDLDCPGKTRLGPGRRIRQRTGYRDDGSTTTVTAALRSKTLSLPVSSTV